MFVRRGVDPRAYPLRAPVTTGQGVGWDSEPFCALGRGEEFAFA